MTLACAGSAVRCVQWTTPELEVLRRLYPSGGSRAVRKHLPHRTASSIWRKAQRLGIAGTAPPGQLMGAYLGSVYNLRTLRERCVVDQGGLGINVCWHLRGPSGQPMPKGLGRSHQVHVHGIGKITAARAAWTFAHGDGAADGLVVFRTCDSYDCVNPAHLAAGSRKDLGAMVTQRGVLVGITSRDIAARHAGRKRRKLTAEQVAMIKERSDVSAVKLAAELGVSNTTINDIRRGNRYRDTAHGASVFNLGGSR